MYRIIDMIEFTEGWLRHYPDKQARYGEGLLVILDPEDTAKGFAECATQAEFRALRAQPVRLAIDFVERNPAGTVGLFFRGARREEIMPEATVTVS
jgi:hypothetical protein